jgi:predicted transcriptional regulator
MASKRIGSLIVVKNNNPVGILTERDIIKEVVAVPKDPTKLRVREIMKSPIIYVKPNDSINQIIEKMNKHKIRRFPVLENGKVVGMITNTDIARLSPEMFEVLELRLKIKGDEPFIRETTTSGVCGKCGNYSDDLVLIKNEWFCGFCRSSL